MHQFILSIAPPSPISPSSTPHRPPMRPERAYLLSIHSSWISIQPLSWVFHVRQCLHCQHSLLTAFVILDWPAVWTSTQVDYVGPDCNTLETEDCWRPVVLASTVPILDSSGSSRPWTKISPAVVQPSVFFDPSTSMYAWGTSAFVTSDLSMYGV